MNTLIHATQRLRRRAQLVAALLLCSLLLWPTQPAAAEGSRSLYPASYPSNGFRANLEWHNDQNRYGPANEFNLIRRTLLRVYAEAGEYILAGSSAIDVPDLSGAADQGDILIYDQILGGRIGNEILPTTPVFSCKAQRDSTSNSNQGRISSRSQEIAGPDTIADAATATRGNAIPQGYVPCFYQAPATGIYYIVFYGPDGNAATVDTLPNGSISNFQTSSAQSTTIPAWDVTVRESLTSTQDLLGRLYTYYLSMFTGTNGRPIFSTVYIVTDDGFRYKVDLNGMDPNGFIIYGNQVGFLDTDGSPLYQDVMAKLEENGVPLTFEQQNQLRAIQGDVSIALPEYLMFFNEPDEQVLQFLGIPLEPIIPEISNFRFEGALGAGTAAPCTNDPNAPACGGTFRFTTNVTGTYDIVISRDGVNFDPDNPQNRELTGDTNTTQVTKEWDGLDNNGDPFPVGGPYIARITMHGGELHFPFLDVENSTLGSPMLLLLNPPDVNNDGTGDCDRMAAGCTGAFYDDRGYETASGVVVGTGVNQPLCPGNPGNPPNPLFDLNGYDTTVIPNQRAFGFPTGGNPQDICAPDGGFGDKKGLDLWTFFPSDPVTTPLIILDTTAIDLVSFTARPQQGAIALRWETSAEVNTFGFHLFRSSDGTRANATRITPNIIPATGRGQGGAVYTWTDQTAQPGQTYAYWLQEVEVDGATNEYGPVTASLGQPTAQWRVFMPYIR